MILQGRAVPAKEYTFGEGRAQVVCCLIAAYAMCQFPLDLDLTDGKRHHLLRLRGELLLEYLDCSPKQVKIDLSPVQEAFVEVRSSKTGSNLVHAFCCQSALSCAT